MSEDDANGFSVRVAEVGSGWEVHILGPGGAIESTRRCADETEARTYASTVQQHVYWLSPGKFREYYRLEQPRGV